MSRMLSLGFFGSHQFRNMKDYFKWLFSGVYRQVHERERNKLWEELRALGDLRRMLVHRGPQNQVVVEYP